MEKVRAYGAGNVRIGTTLSMDEDIYSLTFVSLLSDDCICQYFDVITGELINLSDSDSEEEVNVESKSPISLLKPKTIQKEEKKDEFTLELQE
jgi:hypothetical protein